MKDIALETPETARKYILECDPFTDHDLKHIRRLMKEIDETIKIYEKGITKMARHNWYPNNPTERAVMFAAQKQIVKERKGVVRAAKRLLRLIR